MIKAILSVLFGFILVFIQGTIVIKVHDYNSLVFSSIQLFMVFWALNFCYIHSILSKLENWLINSEKAKLFSLK